MRKHRRILRIYKRFLKIKLQVADLLTQEYLNNFETSTEEEKNKLSELLNYFELKEDKISESVCLLVEK